MTGASLPSQREKHRWMSAPQTFCIKNWKDPEVSGAVWGQTRCWKPPPAAYGTSSTAGARAAATQHSHLQECISLSPVIPVP